MDEFTGTPTFKISHGRVEMHGWKLDSSGTWVDSSGAPLSHEDAIKAQKMFEHNTELDIRNGRA